MSIVLKDGTVLPDIPSEVLASYPYGTIYKETTSRSVKYGICVSDTPIVFIPRSIAEAIAGTLITNSLAEGVMYNTLAYRADCNSDETGWEDLTIFKNAYVQYEGQMIVAVGSFYASTYEFPYSNHDIYAVTSFDVNTGSYETGDIYLPSSVVSTPPFFLPDGTELPALPEGCFEKYPYGMISYVESTDGEAAYALSVAEGTYIFAPGSATGEGSDYVISLLPGYRHYRYVVAPTAASGWEQYAESTTQHSGHDFSREDGTIEIRWCNHDILTATAMNDDGTPEIGPDLYRKSDVNYRIYGGWLNSMGNQARRLGNVSGALKPGEMESVFSGATLEPLTVTPTTEEQTFTPESPCIGFSVVTVEAAPDTGGGDIVEPETYPDAENVNFGTTSAGKDLYTGKYFYGTWPDALPRVQPPDDCPYLALIYKSSDGLRMIATSEPLYYSGGYLRYLWSTTRCNCIYNEDTDTWDMTSIPAASSGIYEYTILYWNNYDIPNGWYNGSYGSTIYKEKAAAPVPETVVGADTSYIETAETYTISGATLNALGAVTQQITGIAATTPSAMVSALQMYAGTH